jgi:hypothetical protein
MKTAIWFGVVTVLLGVFASGQPALAQQVLISGSVRTASGVPVPGVRMSGLPGEPTTDSSGAYAAKVSRGWSGRVTPTHLCYSFSPASGDYVDVVAAQSTDYVATAIASTISGYVKTSLGMAIPGVAINGLPGSPTTDSFGFYSATVGCGWSGTARPSRYGYTFFPALLSYGDVSANRTNQDYTGAGADSVIISGHVTTLEGMAIPGVTINGLPGSPITDASGFYSAKVSSDWSGIATPNLVGYAFTPPSVTYMHVSVDTPNQNYTGRTETAVPGSQDLFRASMRTRRDPGPPQSAVPSVSS